ncbi:MAG: hypothetical protein FWH03_03145 [Firmicutes bacterium]|nr:hypothetical protein [Bacillota bacterium]
MEREEKKLKITVAAGDIFTLVCTLAFLAYLIILNEADSGKRWYHFSMLALTLAFAVFLVVKLFIINPLLKPDSKVSKRIKVAYRFVKLLLKLLMLTAIMVGVVKIVHFEEDGMLILFSTVVSNLAFFVLLVWDIIWLAHLRKKKKLREADKK